MLIQQIKQNILDIEETLKSLSTHSLNSHLVVDISRGFATYWKYNNGKKNYIKRTETKQIKQLAQNTYEKKLLKAAEDEKKALLKCLRILENSQFMESVYEELIPELKQYVDPKAPSDEYAREWQSERFRRNNRVPAKPFKTLRGEIVRSKSELMIADRLFLAGIPYHYEKPVYIQALGTFIYPDFTILNKRTKEVYFWEHLGMMGEGQYREENLKKIELYATEDIVLGKNLITTYECPERQLSTDLIDKIIKELFV